MVSPCGFHADFFDESSAPEWTEADHLSDVEVNQMMVRRMMDADKERK